MALFVLPAMGAPNFVDLGYYAGTDTTIPRAESRISKGDDQTVGTSRRASNQ
jgi:hypothetical protein